MSMYLDVEKLRTIVEALDGLNASQYPVSITRFRCVGHTVIIERSNDKDDASPYVVKGITTGVVRDNTGRNR